jgi:predicted nuclease of restriction endonuclease-like (RecB) superfamily
MSKEIKVQDDALRLNQDYKHFLTDIKTRLQTAQIRAALAANSELIQFYWGLGTELIEKQKSHQWGTGFLEQFSHDMREAFPEMQGFSVRNLQRMKQFATLYSNISITTQAVSQLPWGHITRLMQMVKDDTTREWYATQTIKNGWSRSILEMQIESGLYERQGIAEYALRNISAPIGVSEYTLSKSIPTDLKGSLPTVEEIEAELNESVKED